MHQALQFIAQCSVPVFIVASMLAAGLDLTATAVLAPLKNARLVAAALFVNFVVAPFTACVLTAIVSLAQPYAIGLILFSSAAGAPFIPKLAAAANVDPAVSAALMVMLTAGTIIYMPFVLPILVPSLHASPWQTAQPLVIFMVLPFLAAMLVRHRAPRLAGRCRPPIGAIASASLLVLLVLLVGLNFGALVGVVGSGALAVSMVFTVIVLVAGYAAGGPDARNGSALGLASAARNIGAALPAARMSSDPKVVIMLLVATVASLVISAVAARRMRGQTAALHA